MICGRRKRVIHMSNATKQKINGKLASFKREWHEYLYLMDIARYGKRR